MKKNTDIIKLTASMIIFGTIGIFRRYISMPSGRIAFFRGAIGCVFLLLFMLLTRKKISVSEIKKNLVFLILSGAFIGFNWILLFEAYRYTSVSTATLCYYMQPVFVILASAPIFGEKLTAKKILCASVAFLGMILISGVISGTGFAFEEMKGILFGLGAAVLYSGVVILNKKMSAISSYDRTLVQLGTAAVVILPYTFLFERSEAASSGSFAVLMLIVVGIVHTGIAYALYFGSMDGVKAQTVAIMSYIDPVVAIILSAVILKEPMGAADIIGSVLVLGAAFLSEFEPKHLRNKTSK